MILLALTYRAFFLSMLTDGTSNIIQSMNRRGIKRIAVVTSIGAGDSENQAPLAFKALMYTVMRSIFTDKNKQEALFLAPEAEGRNLEWCIVRPGGLGEGPPTGIINVIDGQAGSIQVRNFIFELRHRNIKRFHVFHFICSVLT